MPRRACLLLLLALPPVIVTALAATGSADTTIVAKERLEAPGEPGTTSTLTRYYKGNKARIDKEPGQYVVLDRQSGDLSDVNEKRKEVAVWSRGDRRAAAAAQKLFFGSVFEPLKNLSLTRTGNTREIKGYTCHEYVATGAGIHIVAWATEEVDTTELEAFAAGFSDDDLELGIVPRLAVKGMVMSAEIKIAIGGRSATVTSEVQRIARTALPDSLFDVPSHYKTRRGLGPDPAEREKTDRLVEAIGKRRQQFEQSGRIGTATHQLSCPTSHDDLSPRYTNVYERITLLIPVTVKAPGKYMVQVKYTSELNRPTPDRWWVKQPPKEQFYELPAGTHHVEFVFAFRDTLGMFVKAPESQIDVVVYRHASEHEIYGDIGPEYSKQPQYVKVTTRTQRLPTVANAYITGLKGLRCPTQ